MGTGTTIWYGCVAAFQQNGLQGSSSTRFLVPEISTPSASLRSAILRNAPAPAFANAAAHAPGARNLDITLIRFLSPDLARDSPTHSVHQSCPVCAMPASLLCPCCETQFCRSHLYQCADCQTTLCGSCLDLHNLEGHWCDSDTVSVMLQLGAGRAECTRLTQATAGHRELAPAGIARSELAATHTQPAHARAEHRQPGPAHTQPGPACSGHNHFSSGRAEPDRSASVRIQCNYAGSALTEPDHPLAQSAHTPQTVYPSCRR